MIYGPKRLFLLRYGSRNTRHIDFLPVDRLSTDTPGFGASYNELRQQHLEYRNMRSVHSRMDTINAEVRRLNGCLNQIENLNPSGASEKDIVSIIYVLFF